MTKLKREPIVIKSSIKESIIDFPKLEITVEQKTYDISELTTLENIHAIATALKIYLKGQQSSRAVFLELRNFLRFISKHSQKIDEKSIIKYKKSLDAYIDNGLSTKYQKLTRAIAFVKLLIQEDILEDFPIPPNFPNFNGNQKDSFAEIARCYIEDDSHFDHQDIKVIMDRFELEHLQAKALSYSLGAIDIIHKKAIVDIYKWEEDWEKVEKIIEQLSENDLKKLRCVTDFNSFYRIRERTLEEAFQILYSKFGNNIPAVKYWPKGMEEFFRSKSWKSSRVKNLLNGISTNVDDMTILNKSINNLSLEQKEELNKVETYYVDSDGRDPRTIELALSILYANYGRILPESIKWPKGITDYLKYRKWGSSRVHSAFFPTPETLAPFIVGLLSHIEIAPNVDCVAFYTYLTSFKPSSKEGKTHVFMDKPRANKPIEKDIKTTDPMISLCIKHSERMLSVLKSIQTIEANNLILNRKTPLFIQHNTILTGRDIHTLDSSTVVNIVKRFLADLAKEDPFILPLVEGGCTGQNFRPTIVLIQKLCGESTRVIQKLLNHSNSATTKIYTERVLTQSIILNKSKKFQRYLVKNALKNDSSNNGQLLNTVIEDAVDEWIKCDAKRIWFKDDEVIADWLAWEKIISDSENELKFENPIRWEKYWLPRLVKYQSLLENVLEIDKKSALTLAETIKLPPLS